MLREDFERLFSREEKALAPSYESIYRKNGHHIVDNQQESVTRFYNSYGWESKSRGINNDDHLSIELLFLTILVEKYLIMDDEACRIEMRGEIRRFIDKHILSWVPAWNEKIQHHARTLCYKGIATLIFACVEDLYSILGDNTHASFQNENIKNLD
jgi:TorA maturation chaperone TorD